ncbi:hypothetical protein LV84_03028 [Algoriphagus ratkowskyi]|uniref:Uncharacterized protein n=1 Tax=Algoriphagus ratkowskyi TaxID=57028 RepID=A0A2W7R6G3_9BACT|nr:hypothetical protein [Algoriphagus ratkowskyi]PZX53920.1 hypothetical protein LV84_03028 [Algoriphagus ratkowskyi]TXD76680.1 hypothetical protein ESW18_15055 [Algoriphagus ratkowskyi]
MSLTNTVRSNSDSRKLCVGNTIWRARGAGQTSGDESVSSDNLYCNSVNLVNAGFIYSQFTKETHGINFCIRIEAQHGIERIILFSGALDLAYIAGGL